MWWTAGIAIALLIVIQLRFWRREPASHTVGHEDRRRNGRVALATPVGVYGWLTDEPFTESTETVNVSAGSGLITLAAPVTPSQELILTNLQTNEDVRCRVARTTRGADGKTLAGLHFVEAAPSFWQVDFVATAAHSWAEPELLEGNAVRR